MFGFHLANDDRMMNFNNIGLATFRAIKYNNMADLERISEFTDLSKLADDRGNTVLVFAIRKNSIKEIVIFLLENGLDPNVSKNSKTPLAWAAQVGNLENVMSLIQYGACINLLSQDGSTPLGIAVRYANEDVVDYLLSLDVKVDSFSTGENGKSPLHWAILNEDVQISTWLLDRGATIFNQILLDAIGTNNLEIVKLMATRRTLELALRMDMYEISKLLLDNGANVVEDLGGRDASYLVEFLEQCKFAMVKLLVEKGARINVIADCGETVFTKAIQKGYLEMVKYLLQRGADVNQVNASGQKPVSVAVLNNDLLIFRQLIHSGAIITAEDLKSDVELAKYHKMTTRDNV